MKKKEIVKKEVVKTPAKKYTRKPVAKKDDAKKKEKEVHLCSKCLKDINPTLLKWVTVTDYFNITYQILICDHCIEKKDEYMYMYEKFEVASTLYKKREYKKKVKDA
jgi:hypothetical protein